MTPYPAPGHWSARDARAPAVSARIRAVLACVLLLAAAGCEGSRREGRQRALWWEVENRRAQLAWMEERSSELAPLAHSRSVERSLRRDYEDLLKRNHLSERRRERLAERARRRNWADAGICAHARETDEPLRIGHRLRVLPWLLEMPDAPPPAGWCAAPTEGVVVLEAIVGAEGRVREPRLLREVAPQLDAAALRIVQDSRWVPLFLCGAPRSVALTLALAHDAESACRPGASSLFEFGARSPEPGK